MSGYLPNSYSGVAALNPGPGNVCNGAPLPASNTYTGVRQIQDYAYHTFPNHANYPRFPPYNRLDVRPISSHPVDNYYPDTRYSQNLNSSHSQCTNNQFSDLTPRELEKFSSCTRNTISAYDPRETNLSNHSSPSPTSPTQDNYGNANDNDSKSNDEGEDEALDGDENSSNFPIYPWMRSQYGEDRYLQLNELF